MKCLLVTEPYSDNQGQTPNTKHQTKKMASVKILWVDDETESLQSQKLFLEHKGYEVFTLTNGFDAIEYVKSHPVDLVLMDLKMPVMDGIEATIKLKQQFPDMPIIAQTAYASPEEREQVLQAGCDDYISKPIKKSALMEIIGKILA